MASKPSGRRRADVEVNILDQFELRSRRAVEEKQSAKLRRLASREAKRALRRERLLADLIAEGTQSSAAPSSRFSVAAVTTVKSLKKSLLNLATMGVAAGLVATFSLPSYAISPDIAAQASLTTNNVYDWLDPNVDTQGLTVTEVVNLKFNARGVYKTGAISSVLRIRLVNAYNNYSGPTAADYVANPTYSTITSAQVMKVAAKYVGVPYIYGGDNPRGFDCSGYVMFVFAQFGVALPHSVRGQDWLAHERNGAIYVKPEDAVPGDIVVWNDGSHDGIYAGGDLFYHAPRPGDRVKLAKIFAPHHFIRVGVKTD